MKTKKNKFVNRSNNVYIFKMRRYFQAELCLFVSPMCILNLLSALFLVTVYFTDQNKFPCCEKRHEKHDHLFQFTYFKLGEKGSGKRSH